MARRPKRTGPHIFWRNGRAYADLRSFEDVGGGREALAAPGSTWGTTEPDLADELFDARLFQLEELRRGRVGAPQQKSITLAKLVRDHLVKKEKAGKTSDSHLFDLESRLTVAVAHFGRDRDPRSITPDNVRSWAEELADGGNRKPGTVRHYLNALSGLYGRAQEGLYVQPGYNPVSALRDKPTSTRTTEAAFFEVADAALLLEAARILDGQRGGHPGDDGNRATATAGLYPIIATFMLTGGRKSEVLGLDVEDVGFDRGVVRFRPNAHRGLKTTTSHRVVPLWPQLREILQTWMYGGDTPRTSGLLFPAEHGGKLGNLRRSLDAMATMCGMEEGEVRTRAFRHTYCSARLQTVQRILRPGADPADEQAFDYVEVSRFQVQKEMGHGGGQLVNRIYGHAQRLPYRSEAVEYRVEQHTEELGARLQDPVAFPG